MFVDLLDKLRCLNSHEDSPLVVTTAVTFNRQIREGLLGCPVCEAEYPIHDGVVNYGGGVPVPSLPLDFFSRERVTALGAMLGLDERGGLYVLDCVSALQTANLTELSPDSQFIAISLNAVDGAGGTIRCDGILPLAHGCARGIAIDRSSSEMLRSAALALVPGGRLVARADARVPYGIREIARDANYWVGEREFTPAVSEIRRAPR